MKPKDLTIDDIRVGDSASFERTWKDADIENFAKLSGNMNPLHVDENYAKGTKFKHRLIFGMHVAVICSTLVGMYLPGKRCLCLCQSLNFKGPVFVGDTTKITGTVKSKSLSTGILDILIAVTREGIKVIDGTMTVQVLA